MLAEEWVVAESPLGVGSQRFGSVFRRQIIYNTAASCRERSTIIIRSFFIRSETAETQTTDPPAGVWHAGEQCADVYRVDGVNRY